MMMKNLFKNLIAFSGLLLTVNISFAQTATPAAEQPAMKQKLNMNHIEVRVTKKVQQGENATEKHFYVPEEIKSDVAVVEKNSVTAVECLTSKATVHSKTSNANPK